jgi:hypothetical protein
MNRRICRSLASVVMVAAGELRAPGNLRYPLSGGPGCSA